MVVQDQELEELFNYESQNLGFWKKEEVFNKDYVPKHILHRSEEKAKIVSGLGGVIRGQRPYDVLIYGKSGCGKTLLLTNILDFFKSKLGNKIHYFLINCMEGGKPLSTYKIMTSLLKNYFNITINKGYDTNDLIDKFWDQVKKLDGQVLLVFDEMDSFLEKNDDNLIYTISRINEIRKDLKPKINLVGISNQINLSTKLSSRVLTSLNIWNVFFDSYNAPQVNDILKARVEEGLQEGVIEEGFIETIGAKVAQNDGDLRRGLKLFKLCVNLATTEKLKTLSPDLVTRATKLMENDEIFQSIKRLKKKEKVIFRSILKTSMQEKTNLITNKTTTIRKDTTSGETYDYYCKSAKDFGLNVTTYTDFYKTISTFEIMNLISTNKMNKGRYGVTRFLKPSIPHSFYNEVLQIIEDDLNGVY